MSSQSWLAEIQHANESFTASIAPSKLPVARAPGPAVITCMDPRVNLNAIGIADFAEDGSNDSTVRIIRTIGGRVDVRSLIVGVFLANISEIVVLMHTDCGCCLAHHNIDTMINRMENRLSSEHLLAFRDNIGEPFQENLRSYLNTFSDPFEAVREEVEAIKALPYAPPDLIIHGLVYTLETGRIEVVVDGYA
jgi:carbonic anhydrase